MTRVVAVLDTAWGGGGKWFRINPRNFTGRRLYQMLGHQDLVVTNACAEVVSSAEEHGTPDPGRLLENLRALSPIKLLIICGSVARLTFDRTEFRNYQSIVRMPHPAARGWTKQGLENAKHVVRMVEKGQLMAATVDTLGGTSTP